MIACFPKRRARRFAVGGFGIALLLLCAALLGAYLERGPIGVRFATDYLRRRGVEARIRVDRLDPGGFSGAVSLGPRDHPDFVADQVEVEFAPVPLLLRGFSVPRLRSVRLLRPRLHARWQGGRLTFGSLQPLVDEALAHPGSGAGPDAHVQSGLLTIDTAGGPITVEADGAAVKGEVAWARLHLRPVDLNVSRLRFGALTGGLDMRAHGPREMAVRFDVAARTADTPVATGRSWSVVGEADIAHDPRDLTRLDGPLRLQASLAAARMAVRDAAMGPSTARFNYAGEGHGPAVRPDLSGRAQLSLRVADGRWRDATGEAASFDLTVDDASLRRVGRDWAAQGYLRAALSAAQATVAYGGRRLDLAQIRLRSHGRAAWARAFTLLLDSDVSADLRIPPAEARSLAGSVPRSAPELRLASARALQALRLEAPSVTLDWSGLRRQLTLGRPLRLVAQSGAVLAVSGRPNGPVVALSGSGTSGAADLTLLGGGLPEVGLAIGRYRLGRDASGTAFSLQGGLRFAGSLPGLRGAKAGLQVAATRNGGLLRLVALGCGPVRADVVGVGKPIATALGFQLCPAAGGPLLVERNGRWRAQAAFRGLTLSASAALAVSAGEGALGVSGGGRLVGAVSLDRLMLVDEERPIRFQPIATAGLLSLSGETVQGTLTAALIKSPGVRATIKLTHDLRLSRGGATLEAPSLAFAPGKLQPQDVLPLLGRSFTRVQGPTPVSASVNWGPAGLTSSGRVTLQGVNLHTPLGYFKGVRGTLALTSLAPLISAPNQRLTAARLETALPLTDISAVFALGPGGLTLADATAALAKGRVELGPMAVPFGPKATLGGTATLKGVDLAEVNQILNLSNAVKIEARVDGVLPFVLGPAGLRITGGKLFAVGPGRLSIRREALSGAPKAQAAGLGRTNAVQDFAYQALENLAFDSMSAAVDSKPKGRLGVLFNIHGRHDPPVSRPTRLGLLDLLRGRAFDKPIPLPKGTPVNLTLDTSLNLDDILAAYRGLNASSGSAKVQP